MNFSINNCTTGNEFHLLSFALSGPSKVVVLILIFFMYSVTVLGNVLIITLICLTSHLHTPMYFFLCNLSVQDLIFVSDILPKFLSNTISGDDRNSFPECINQLFIFTFCIGTEYILLTSMAYDRYVAICVPLHYTILMKNLVSILAGVSWSVGFTNALIQSILLSFNEFCMSHNVDHFYCEPKIMKELASSDTTILKNYLLFGIIVLGYLPFILILVSYLHIITAITNVRSSGGRGKAFSSCSSHLTIVLLFCGGSIGTYTIPESEHSQEYNKLLSLVYTALVPFLNPLVYTLRNKEVWRAMKKVKEKCLKFRCLTLPQRQ